MRLSYLHYMLVMSLEEGLGSHKGNRATAFLRMALNRGLLEARKSTLALLPGFKIHDLKKSVDERGFFAEIYRADWRDLLGDDKVVQANLSYSYPGMVRAWHRHDRGQVDYFIVLKGALKICAYDDRQGSPTKGQFAEVVASEERLQSVRVPGFYWHGTKAVSDKPSLAVYCVNRMYDAQNPDEERRAWNDNSIVDPRTGKPYEWNAPPHK